MPESRIGFGHQVKKDENAIRLFLNQAGRCKGEQVEKMCNFSAALMRMRKDDEHRVMTSCARDKVVSNTGLNIDSRWHGQ